MGAGQYADVGACVSTWVGVGRAPYPGWVTQDPALAALARVRAAAKGSRDGRRRPVVPTTMTSAGPDDRDPQSVGSCVTRWVRGNGYNAELAVAGVAAQWNQIVGDHVAEHVTVGEYTPLDTGGELVVLADSQEWALQMRYLISQIQRRIDEEIGAGVVTRICVKGPGPARTGGWRVRTGRRSPRQPQVQPPPAAPDTLGLE